MTQRPSRALGLACCAALCAAALALPAFAGWSVPLLDGRSVAIVNDATTPGQQFLERRNPDGSPDLLFGRSGRIAFSFGADGSGATAIRADAQGRLLVAGAVAASAQQVKVPATMRFLPDGRPDTTWGRQGLGIAPGWTDADAHVADLLPLDDGSVLLLGHVEVGPDDRVTLWLLRGDGTADPSFGRGGVLPADGFDVAQPQQLQRDQDGAALIVVLHRLQGTPGLEVHRWQPGLAQPQRIARQPVPPAWTGPFGLRRRANAWQWIDASQIPTQAGAPLVTGTAVAMWTSAADGTPAQASGSAAPAAQEPAQGHAGFNPFTVDEKSDRISELLAEGAGWVGLVLGGLVVLGALAWWQTRRR